MAQQIIPVIDDFRRFLYKISLNISKKELNDLLYICKVSASVQNDIKDGKDLFKHLEERNGLNEQNIHILRDCLNCLRPKRKDLVRQVDEYKKSVTADNVSSLVSDDIGSSVSAHTNAEKNAEPYCGVDCVCIRFHGCSVTKPTCCWCLLVIVMVLCLLLAIVFWFVRKPKNLSEYLNANETRRDLGYFAVGLPSFFLVLEILVLLWKKRKRISFWCRRKKHHTVVERKRRARSSMGPESLAATTESQQPKGGTELQEVTSKDQTPDAKHERAVSLGEISNTPIYKAARSNSNISSDSYL